VQAQLASEAAAADERYSNLAQAFGELQDRWDTRGPREEDAHVISELRAALEERDARLAGYDQRFNELHMVCVDHMHVVRRLCGQDGSWD
jgi:hypothetical protein